MIIANVHFHQEIPLLLWEEVWYDEKNYMQDKAWVLEFVALDSTPTLVNSQLWDFGKSINLFDL